MTMTGAPSSESTQTHCPFCALNCGISLEHQAGTVIGAAGWSKAPLTSGALCLKGRLAHQTTTHAERLTMPLIRRGSDFEETDWSTALDLAAEGFARIRSEAGPDANAMLGGGSLTNEKTYLVGKFARLALGTPHVDYNGRFCMTSAGAAHSMAFGMDRMMTPLDELERAEVVVVVGSNLSTSFPVRIPQLIEGVRRRGGTVIVIDPRASRFVKDGDLHVALRPGTDATFFGSLLRSVIHQGLTDRDFIADRTSFFHEAAASVTALTPEQAGSICDVDPELIQRVANAVGSTRRCMWLHGRGPEQQVSGVANVLSIINVGLACGHVGRPGAGINMLTGQRNGQGGREWGQRCNQLPAGRNIASEADRAIVAERWGVPADDLPGVGATYVEILEMAGRGEIRGLLTLGTNMSISAPDLSEVNAQLRRLEHHVVVDPFFTESAAHAHVVLPGPTFVEESGTITTLEGRVVRVDQAVPRQGLHGDIEILRELATRLGAERHLAVASPQGIFDEMRRVSAGGPVDYNGMTWERLRAEDGIFWPCPSADHPGTPQLFVERFAHEDGRARFHVVASDSPSPGTDEAYPFVLTTGRSLSQFLSGSQTKRLGRLNRQSPSPVLEVHPDTAAELSLTAEQPVVLESRQGRSSVDWRPNPKLRTDTVFLPYHWEECNRLVAAALDPISGIPGFKFTPVRITPSCSPAPSEAHP